MAIDVTQESEATGIQPVSGTQQETGNYVSNAGVSTPNQDINLVYVIIALGIVCTVLAIALAYFIGRLKRKS